jgi:hypothetical protein
MKFNFLTIIAGLIFTSALGFQTIKAQTAKKIPTREASLVAQLVKEANEPDSHSAGDVYLLITIGKTDYVAELKSGKVLSQKSAENPSGGFSGAYAEVSLMLLDKSRRETSQGAGQILKLSGNNWKRIALSEGDYQCAAVKTVPKSVLKVFKVECN